MTRDIGFLIFPDFQLLDAAGPIAAFEIAARFQPGAYAIHLVAPEAGLRTPPASRPPPASPAPTPVIPAARRNFRRSTPFSALRSIAFRMNSLSNMLLSRVEDAHWTGTRPRSHDACG